MALRLQVKVLKGLLSKYSDEATVVFKANGLTVEDQVELPPGATTGGRGVVSPTEAAAVTN